jgi:hypothetical protein
MGQYFGPRRVRVRTSGVRSDQSSPTAPGGAPWEAPAEPAEVLEGEIVDPR